MTLSRFLDWLTYLDRRPEEVSRERWIGMMAFFRTRIELSEPWEWPDV